MYANGQVPLSVLVHVAANVWLPPGTLARWNWAVQQAKAKYGVTLRITGQHSSAWNTWNGYRPLSAQILYRNAYGIMAAYPGTSSHGGTYRGKEVFAIDVDNWAELGWARFAAIMRLAGLTVDFVTPQERWHVGDMNNVWAIPAFASGGSGSAITPGTPSKPEPPKEWDEMATKEEIRAVVADEVQKGTRSALRIVGIAPGKMYLTGPGGVMHINGVTIGNTTTNARDDLALLRRHIGAAVGIPTGNNAGQGEETFTQKQVDTIAWYLRNLS